jgi:hypothetical protein
VGQVRRQGRQPARPLRRKIDTQLTPPLFDMINQISKDDEKLPDPVR